MLKKLILVFTLVLGLGSVVPAAVAQDEAEFMRVEATFVYPDTLAYDDELYA